jgi:hypothetical protein
MNDFSSRYTPINDSDPLCIRTSVSLCIYKIDPDYVTETLNINPTIRHKKGAITTLPSGKEIIGKVNSWVLESDKYISSKDIRTHLDWLLDMIEPHIRELKELQRIPTTKMAIRCSWWSAEEDGGALALWPEQMKRIAKANLELELLIACYGNRPENTESE